VNKDLTNIDNLKACLGKSGIRPQLSTGQNFLVCEEVAQATVAAIEGGPKDVIELGAGAGSLTNYLLAGGYDVRVIERDKQLVKVLMNNLPKKYRDKLDLVIGDLRKVSWLPDKLVENGGSYQIVGNIPYNLSGLIIRRVVQLEPVPERVVLLVQREVGERLMAKPPNMHLISLAVRLWGKASLLMGVPADCFWPKPKVESALMMLTPENEDNIGKDEREKIMVVAREFFQHRRKQLAGVMKNKLGFVSQEEAIKLLHGAGINGSQRPQEITTEQWRALVRML